MTPPSRTRRARAPANGSPATTGAPGDVAPRDRLLGASRLASPVARRVVLGLDQAAVSGWAIAYERGPVIAFGLARKHDERVAAVARAVDIAGGDPRLVYVLFEQHDHMPIDRLGRHDHTTRRNGRGGGVERGPRQLHGMGKAYGRWEAACDQCKQPERMRGEVRPTTWRARVHGVTRGDAETLKGAAVDWARRAGFDVVDHNAAEAICITAYGALDGLAAHDAEGARKRVEQRAKAAGKRQGALVFGHAPDNDNNGEEV